jgi:alkylation response protein AidB-like acyl-CoA dehydrogenase
MIVSTRAAASLELKHELRTQARTWQARAREFAEQVVQPLGQVLDRMDAQAAVAPGSPVYDLLAQAQREGYTRLTDSPQRGGVGLSRDAEYLVLEELATADAGLTALLIMAPLPFRLAGAVSFGALARSLSLPYFRLERLDWCGCHAPVEQGTVTATRADDGWLLNGSTAAMTGAAVATHAAVGCTLEPAGLSGSALAIVPLDRVGVSRGRASDQLGLRTRARASLGLDGVRLSSDELLIAPRTSAGHVRAASALDHVANAIAAVGVGRAAYEGALRSVRERFLGECGATEREHAERCLFRLFTLLKAARATTRAAHRHTEPGSRSGAFESLQQAAAAHAFAVDAALAIATGAVALCKPCADPCGAVEYLDGSSFRPERLLRDATHHNLNRPLDGGAALVAGENR